MAFDFDSLKKQAKAKDDAVRKAGLQSKTAYKPTVNNLPTVSVAPAVQSGSSWVSTGAGRKSTVGDLDSALARLEEARKKAAYIDNDDAAVLDINRQMKELRAQFGQQTAGDRAWDISSAIVNPVLGQTVNVAGVIANTVDNVDRHKSDLERMRAVLAAGKTTDGKTLTAEQRKGVENRIKELEEQIRQEEAGETVHGKIYKWADERAEMGAKAQESAKLGLGTTGQTLVDAGVAFGQSALAGAVGGATGTGMLPFAVQAFGGATQDARQSGATLNQQIAYGAAQAGKEYLTEKLFGLALPQKLAGSTGSFDDVTEKAIRKAVEKFAKTEAGQRVLGGVGTWLIGGVTEGLEEFIGAGIENIVINPVLRGFDPDTRTSEEKWEEAWYSAIVGGLSGLFGVTNLVGYQPSAKSTKTAAVTSPAAAPEVQQLSEQAEVTQELNPDSKVLDAATTLFMNEQGCNQKTAEFRASVVQKLVAGEEVDTKTLKRIDPTNKTTQRIFTQLTGVQFPTGPADMAAVLPIFRTAHEVAEQRRIAEQEAVAVQEVVDKAQLAADNNINEATQREQVTGEPTIEEFAAKYRTIRPDATDSEIQATYDSLRKDYESSVTKLKLDNGSEMTREQFVAYMADHYKARGENPTPQQLSAMFDQMRALGEQGRVFPYLPNMDKYMKEGQLNGREGNQEGRADRESAVQNRAEPETGRRTDAGESRQSSGKVDAGVSRKAEVSNFKTTSKKVVDGIEALDVVSKKQYTKPMRRIAKKAQRKGYQVVFCTNPIVDSKTGDSGEGLTVANGKKLLLQVNGERGLENTFDHEWIHVLNFTDAGFFDAFENSVLSKLADTFGVTSVDTMREIVDAQLKESKYPAYYGKQFAGTSEAARNSGYREEFYGDLNSDFNEFAGLAGDTFQLFQTVVKEALAEYESSSQETEKQKQIQKAERRAALAEQQDKVDRERSEAVDAAGRAFAMTKSMFWDEQLDNLDEVEKNGRLYLRETPNILAEVGLGDLPMCMSVNHTREAMHPKDESNPHWHGIPMGIMLQLPELLSRPAMVLKSNTQRGDVLVVTTAYDQDKLPVVVAIHPNGIAMVDGEVGPANFITSVYGRYNFAPVPGEPSKNNLLYLSLRNRGILYWNRKRTERLLSRCGLKLPYTVTKIPSDTILGHRDGYRPDRIPERRFAMSNSGGERYEDAVKTKALQDLVDFVDANFKQPDIPDFASWGQAFMHFDQQWNTGKTTLCFDEAPFFPGDTMTFGSKAPGGEFEVLGEYPKTQDGLRQFKADAPKFVEQEEAKNAPVKFKTWEDAFDFLMNKEDTSLQFHYELSDMEEGDKVEIGYMDEEDDFIQVGVFDFDEGGLSEFNSTIYALIEEDALPELELPDEWLLDEDYMFIDDDSTAMPGEYDETKHYIKSKNATLQNNRDEFTDTDTPAFREWHNDDTGELTNSDGRPKVFVRGTPFAGSTKLRDAKDSLSRGLFFTDTDDIAVRYAEGASIGQHLDMAYTAMDQLKGKGLNSASREWKPLHYNSWHNLRKYVKDTFQNVNGDGISLVGINAETGEIMPSDKATTFLLMTNISDFADRRAGLAPLIDAWRTLKQYPATPEGLQEANRDLGDYVRQLGMGIRGYSKFYLSAKNTFVFDNHGDDYGDIPDDALPPKLRSGHPSGTQSINGLAERAFAAGYDCVIVHKVSDVGGVQTQYVVKDPSQVKSVYNIGTWNKNDPDFRYAMAPNSKLDDFLKDVEAEFGEGSAAKMFDAFDRLAASREAARKAASAQPSVGAADLGFDPYTNLANTYGTVEPGENPDKVIDMPAQTKPNNKVSLTPRTVMEAKATPESRIPTIEDAVVDHKFSYIEGHNKIQVRRAVAKLKKEGWAETLTNWTRDVRDGKVNADLVVMGAVMLNNAGNSDMSGARYTQLLVDYTDLLRSAGQATQAARVLKNLTPEARLYGLYGYANRMNDRIRKDDPAHNIPVEKWMEVTGELLAKRLQQSVGGNRSRARTTAQIILKDLNSFAREAFPEKEKSPSRTEMDRLQDLFDNYDNYREAWEAAKDTIRNEYADKPEAMAAFEKFLETDLSEAFLGRYFNAPEVRVRESLAQEFLNAKTEEERNAVIDRIIEDIARQIPATKMEKFTALRYLNMLGNFKTQGRNLLGNSFNLALTGMKNQVAALLEWAVNLNGEKVERTKSFTKDKATYQAALKDFEKMKEIILSGGKYQDGRRFDERIEEKRTIFKNKALEGYRKATNWAMTQGDLVFSRIAYADALAGYLAAHGKTFETAGDTLMEQARNYAVRQAAEATFRDSNMFSEAIAGMRFRNPDTIVKRGINAIGEGVLPFRKTPANILVRAVEYSPVGVLTTVAEAMYGKNKTGAVDGSKVIDSLAKNITGTGLMVLGYALANSGLLHGAAPDDDKEKEFEDLTGHQAYSIELPNGLSLTLDWLAPSSIPLFLGAQIAETAAEDGMAVRTALDAIGSITDPMLQMSMLQGLDDALANASTYGDDSALVRFTGNALWSFMTQGLTNTMLGQLERSLKNERSTTYRDKNKDLPDGLQYLVGKTLEKTPFVDYNQIPYIDAWGRIETNAKTDFGNVFTQFFSPSYVSWVNESDMEEELQRLHDATGEGSVLISRPKSYFNVGKERKDLTAEEYIEYATTRGQLAYNVATDLTESKIYGTLTDKQKVAAVEKAYDFANQVAKATVTGYDPSKWDSDAPEGAAVPDKWVMDAMTDAAEYGIPAGEYAALYAATKDIESYKDKKGETVDNSKSLKLAVVIYDLGLSDAQTDKLMEDFGVNKTVRKYSEKMARRKLDAMKEKYE